MFSQDTLSRTLIIHFVAIHHLHVGDIHHFAFDVHHDKPFVSDLFILRGSRGPLALLHEQCASISSVILCFFHLFSAVDWPISICFGVQSRTRSEDPMLGIAIHVPTSLI
jgi:hypothetical protein